MKTSESPEKLNLKGLTLPELEALVAEWGEPNYRAAQLASWIYGKRVSNFEQDDQFAEKFQGEVND